ncbi:hypothetical protein [Cohnella caldifontis]|uniref:hypothetical protein n=1 Tax=Cohnella caldifontis TaxID=3027471 RepID=UPI0023EC70BB|nr:hypothetical protein [Cohnella sp. YIM B05605]
MIKSKVWLSLVSLILISALILAGCNSDSKSPQEALKASMSKSSEIKSYSFKGSMKIEDLSIPATGDDAASTGAVLNAVKNADLSWTGAYRADPMHLEMTLSLALKGDMAVNFNIPIVMEKEKMWVRIPNIPFFPLPEDMVNKFLELDLKQLAEQSGQPMPSIDPAKSQKFANDILGIIFKNVDEKQYLSEVKAKDAGLPEDADVKQVIQFKVGKDQVEPFINTVVEKIAPEILDLLSSNAEYRDMLGLKQEDLDQAKKDLKGTGKDDISKGLADFKQNVKTLDVVANIGIDAKEYPVYSDVHAKIAGTTDGQEGSIAFKVVSQMADINKDVKLEYPDGPKEIITLEQFEQQMGGAFGAGL